MSGKRQRRYSPAEKELILSAHEQYGRKRMRVVASMIRMPLRTADSIVYKGRPVAGQRASKRGKINVKLSPEIGDFLEAKLKEDNKLTNAQLKIMANQEILRMVCRQLDQDENEPLEKHNENVRHAYERTKIRSNQTVSNFLASRGYTKHKKHKQKDMKDEDGTLPLPPGPDHDLIPLPANPTSSSSSSSSSSNAGGVAASGIVDDATDIRSPTSFSVDEDTEVLIDRLQNARMPRYLDPSTAMRVVRKIIEIDEQKKRVERNEHGQLEENQVEQEDDDEDELSLEPPSDDMSDDSDEEQQENNTAADNTVHSVVRLAPPPPPLPKPDAALIETE